MTKSRIETICRMVGERHTIREIGDHLGITAGAVLATITNGGPEAVEQYARAREAAADLFEADIIAAAEAATPETAAADRIKVDALKWVAARRAPKKYGDRIDHTTGGDKLPAPTTVDLSKLPADVLRTLLGTDGPTTQD